MYSPQREHRRKQRRRLGERVLGFFLLVGFGVGANFVTHGRAFPTMISPPADLYPHFGQTLQNVGGLGGLEGLGASVRAFRRHHTREASQYYTIAATNPKGRVIAYSTRSVAPTSNAAAVTAAEAANGIAMEFWAYSPPDRDKIRAISTRNGVCVIFESAILGRLVGKEYMRGTRANGTDTINIQAASQPTCR